MFSNQAYPEYMNGYEDAEPSTHCQCSELPGTCPGVDVCPYTDQGEEE